MISVEFTHGLLQIVNIRQSAGNQTFTHDRTTLFLQKRVVYTWEVTKIFAHLQMTRSFTNVAMASANVANKLYVCNRVMRHLQMSPVST